MCVFMDACVRAYARAEHEGCLNEWKKKAFYD